MSRNTIIRKYLNENGFNLMQRGLIAESLKLSTDISIVVPAYNEQLYLPRFLLSLNNQSYRNFEVIIVDNGSTDKTKEIVNFWKNKTNYPLYLIAERNKGAANARKRGMDEAIFRVAARGNNFPFHLIVTTDVDATFPNNWLEKMRLKASNPKSVALAGTHQAAPEVDLAIEEKLGIKNYFNLIPLMIEYFAQNNIGTLKMSGPNAAYEIEAYAAGGGMRQEYDEKTGIVRLNEVNSLGKRIKQSGYPIIPMDTRITTSKRRQLKEILNEENSYFPKDFTEKDRFNVVREDENKLLKLALIKANKNSWVKYRQKMITVILNNLIVPTLNIQVDKFAKYFNRKEILIASDLQVLTAKQFAQKAL